MELETLPWNGQKLLKFHKMVWGDMILHPERTMQYGSLYLLNPHDPVWIMKETQLSKATERVNHSAPDYCDDKFWDIEYIKEGVVLDNIHGEMDTSEYLERKGVIPSQTCTIRATVEDGPDDKERTVLWEYDHEIHLKYGYAIALNFNGFQYSYYFIFPTINMVRRFCDTYIHDNMFMLKDGRRMQYVNLLKKLDSMEQSRVNHC